MGRATSAFRDAIKFPFDEWIRHTMRYRDGRFGRHARFRYVVFNMLQREKVRSQASWICREIDGDARMTLEDIQQLVRDGQEGERAGRVSRQGANLVGTRPFLGVDVQGARCHGLES
jgi:hypothetical protein